MGKSEVGENLRLIADAVQRDFARQRRVLSFQEYLELFAQDAARYSRDAATYLRDAFDFYGRDEIQRPWGTTTRYRLFDQNFPPDGEHTQDALVGQESVQAEIYRTLSNFVREGRPNRVILLHGPNGSAKSTIAACLMRALEDYSSRDEGALYRFHWIFPSQTTLRGAIGFGGPKSGSQGGTFAHLGDDQIDARLFVEVRDHPLFLLPRGPREELIHSLYKKAGIKRTPPRWLTHGDLCHKSRRIYDALLASYGGSLDEVLRHIQVERYFISRRYRVGAVTLGPQLSVDAGERQVTADRSVTALPASLQGLTLYDAFGELVDAAGGLLEYSDILKRPLDAFKYLQITAETGEVALDSQTLQVNSVLLASGNEIHLGAFRQHPEFESFRGRLELVRAGYLRSWRDEVKIYDAQIVPQVSTHVAPHATEVAARFAVLSRMRKPSPDRYPRELRDLITELSAFEKMDLYSDGRAPGRLDDDTAKLLRSAIHGLYTETDTSAADYEGGGGASPREMRAVLLDAAQSRRYGYLSPFAVLDELEKLCERVSEYTFLQQERLPGGYHDHAAFREGILRTILDAFEDELRIVSGIVEETRYSELFDRYVTHVSYWVKGEQMRNPMTGAYENPDARLFAEVEKLLGAADKPEQFRRSLISSIAAWAIDHPDDTVDNQRVFSDHLRRLREAVFAERRGALAKLCRDVVLLLREEGAGLDAERRRAAEQALGNLKSRYGYIDDSAADAAAMMLRHRYAELLS